MRDALLKWATLSESEVDAYIAYQESIVYEDVPLDYELTHPDENITLSCLYSDGILQAKILLRHTAQISPETLEKVQRVLPLILCQGHDSYMHWMNFKGSPKDLAENLANDLKARCGKEQEVQSKLSS